MNVTTASPTPSSSGAVTKNIRHLPPRRADGGGASIAPSILSADFGHMARDCQFVLSSAGGGAELLHLDVMDGHFAPNLTFGPDMCRAVRAACPEALLDVHLMVTDPVKFFAPFAKAGANHVTYHCEVIDAGVAASVRKAASDLGMTVGVAINPPTPLERVLGHVEHVDMVLVMSVNPGFSGQAFIPSVLEKVRAIRPRLKDGQRLEMDGGVGLATADACRAAGCDVIVAASAIFGVPPGERAGVIARLRG